MKIVWCVFHLATPTVYGILGCLACMFIRGGQKSEKK